jgi:hypothetical protein
VVVSEQGGLQWLEQAAGVLLMLFTLVDVFLTVLYARANTGLLSRQMARLVWWIFKTISKPFGRAQGSIISFCGPTILVSLVGVWR